MRLHKKFEAKDFINGFDTKYQVPQVIRLLVDNLTIRCSRSVLDVWSREFVNQQEEDEIFLVGFIGAGEEIAKCVALLYGHDVEVQLKDVKIILKFGLQFGVTEMLKESLHYLDVFLTDETKFTAVLDVIAYIERQGYGDSRTYKVVQDFLSKDLAEGLRQIALHDDLLEPDYVNVIMACERSFGHILPVITSRLQEQAQCMHVIRYFEKHLIRGEKLHLFHLHRQQIEELSDKFIELVGDTELLTRWVTVMSTILSASYPVQTINTQFLFQHGPWKKYSHCDMKLLRENPHMTDYHYLELVLEWAKHTRCQGNLVGELFGLVDVVKLSAWYLKRALAEFKLVYPECDVAGWLTGEMDSYEFAMYQDGWKLSTVQRMLLLENEKLRLSRVCGESSIHVVTVQMEDIDGNAVIKTLPSELMDDQREHCVEDESSTYLHWFFFQHAITVTKPNLMVPIFTKSYTQIKQIVRDEENYCCLSLGALFKKTR